MTQVSRGNRERMKRNATETGPLLGEREEGANHETGVRPLALRARKYSPAAGVVQN